MKSNYKYRVNVNKVVEVTRNDNYPRGIMEDRYREDAVVCFDITDEEMIFLMSEIIKIRERRER